MGSSTIGPAAIIYPYEHPRPQDVPMSRMSIFLLVALLLGFSLLFARFKGHEMETRDHS